MLVVAFDVIGVVGTEFDNGISVADPVLKRFVTFIFALLGIFVGIGIGRFVSAVGQKADGGLKWTERDSAGYKG